MSIRTVSSRSVYRNAWMRVREDSIERSNGQAGIYGVVDKDPAAIILPIDGDSIYLVEQFRYTIGRRCLELPQGGWETAEVDAEELARGELREETGLYAGRMTALGAMQIAYGFTNQLQFVFLAEGLSQGRSAPDAEEHDLAVHRVSLDRFQAMLLDGSIVDGCTFSAWGLYQAWLRARGAKT